MVQQQGIIPTEGVELPHPDLVTGRIVAPQGVPHTAEVLPIEVRVTAVRGTVFQDTEVREVAAQAAGLQDSAGVHQDPEVPDTGVHPEVALEAQDSAGVQVVAPADQACAVPVALRDHPVEDPQEEAVAVAEEDVNHPIILIP